MPNRIPPAGAKPSPATAPSSAPVDATPVVETPSVADVEASTPSGQGVTDGFGDAASPAVDTGLRHRGLPDVLFESPHAHVVHGTDPGNYYCEHMFFESQRAAAASSSVGKNASGEHLVGFLHCPQDGFVLQDPVSAGYALADRHAGTREVVGAALAGYFPDAKRAAGTGAVRMMVNGYDRFSGVTNNPTGEFVSHRENLDAAMARAFGTELITAAGEALPPDPNEPAGVMTFRYLVKDPAVTGGREVLLRTQRFPVTDAAIDGQSPESIQHGIKRYEPHAVLCMGVAGRGSYKVEHHADDGGMREGPNGVSHIGGRTPSRTLDDNYALARAIFNGSRPGVSVATLRTGGPAPV